MKTRWKFIILAFIAALIIGGLLFGELGNSRKVRLDITEKKAIESLRTENIPLSEAITNNEDIQKESQIEEKTENIPLIDTNMPVEKKTSEKVTEPEVVSSQKKAQKTQSNGSIIERPITWGFQESNNRSVDTIIVHSSYNALSEDVYSLEGILQEYKQYGVSAHYLIDRGGAIYRLVEEKDIAYHAGVGKTPDGRTSINPFSIGIELMNTTTDKYTDEQYKALNQLISSIKSRYTIKYVLGHDQIAPGRKTDPWNFDWDRVDK